MGKYLIFSAPFARVHGCLGAWAQAHEYTHMRVCTHTYALSQTHTQEQIYTSTQRYYEANPGDLDFLSKSAYENQKLKEDA